MATKNKQATDAMFSILAPKEDAGTASAQTAEAECGKKCRYVISCPQPLYDEIRSYCKNNYISVNTFVLQCVDACLKEKRQ